MRGDVGVALLVTLVLLDVVEVVHALDEGAVHLGRLDGARQDATADGNITGEGALLVDVGTCCGERERERGRGGEQKVSRSAYMASSRVRMSCLMNGVLGDAHAPSLRGERKKNPQKTVEWEHFATRRGWEVGGRKGGESIHDAAPPLPSPPLPAPPPPLPLYKELLSPSPLGTRSLPPSRHPTPSALRGCSPVGACSPQP